jgi:stress-induced morphogen
VHEVGDRSHERAHEPFGKGEQEGGAPCHGYDDSMTAATALESLLRVSFPDATELAVEDRTGGGDHFQVTIASGRFDGLSLVDQHRLVYDALQARLADGSIHELRIKTRGTG